MSEPFLGEIRMFGFNFAPTGWAQCNGQLMSIAQNTALFSLLGTTYGGDGRTTFGLPNLQSRVPVHQGQGPGLSPYIIGEQTGTETHTLLQTEIPAHNHIVNCDGSATGRGGSTFGVGTGETPVNNFPGLAASAVSAVYSGNHNNTMNPGVLSVVGGSQPHSILQPLLVVNFCIALQGIFPSRN